MGALGEAIDKASQGGNNWMFAAREHAPSGFELESNLDDLQAMYARSSVHGGNNEDGGSDDEYVNKSQYEIDVDLEDLVKKMKNEEDVGVDPEEVKMDEYENMSPNKM